MGIKFLDLVPGSATIFFYSDVGLNSLVMTSCCDSLGLYIILFDWKMNGKV
jgi:hypothetical protein